MHRRIENKLWFLIQGPVLEIKASSPGKVEPEWIPLDAADWSPDPKSEDSPKEEATPTILAEYEIESPPTLEYGFELEMADGIQSEYEVET